MKRIFKTRIIKICFIYLFCLNLIACEPVHYYYSYEMLSTNVIGIELIYYNNSKAKIIKGDAILQFDFNKMEVLETLKVESLDNFLKEFSEVQYFINEKHYDSPLDKCIRIMYGNGDFEIDALYYSYTGRFDRDGNVQKFIGGGADNTIIVIVNKYFNTQLNVDLSQRGKI